MCDEENKREGGCSIEVKFLLSYNLLFGFLSIWIPFDEGLCKFLRSGGIAYLHYNIFWKLLNFLYFNGVSCVREGNLVNPSFLFFLFFCA